MLDRYLGDIIIEKWLPYGPLPPRPVIRKRIDPQEASRATCTIINYENTHSHVNRKFVVVDVYNADPKDYVDRYRESLLDSAELVQQVRRVGVNEDIVKCFQSFYQEVTFFVCSRVLRHQYQLLHVQTEKVLIIYSQEKIHVTVFQWESMLLVYKSNTVRDRDTVKPL